MKRHILFIGFTSLLLPGLGSCKKAEFPANVELQPLPKASNTVTADKRGPYDDLLDKIVPGVGRERRQSLWYGLYMQNQKVGWMVQNVQLAEKTVTFDSTMYAKVMGMGRTSEMTIIESRTFDRFSSNLLALTFEQNSPDQMGMSQSGFCQEGQLRLKYKSGNQERESRLDCSETLAGQLLLADLILNNKAVVGSRGTVRRYEPSMMQIVTTEDRFSQITATMVDGVGGQAFYVENVTIDPPGTGIASHDVYDQNGRLISSEVGGFFTARLESEAQARKTEAAKDILTAGVVKLPAAADPQILQGAYQLVFSGFPDDYALPENSSGQQMAKSGEDIVFTINKQLAPAAEVPLTGNTYPENIARYLANEPQYQADAPEIKALVQKLVTGSDSLWTAHGRILQYVYSSLKKEYVPAIANALDVLKIGRGDCTEHSTLYVALARAAGIPARQVVGIAYWPQGGGFGWHAWAEIFVNGEWLAVDPTWGQILADTTHIRLASGGVADQVKISALLGTLAVKELSAR